MSLGYSMRIQFNCTLLIKIGSVDRWGKNKVLRSSREETNTFYYRDRNRRKKELI